VIAFIGSVFSPYYAWAGRREPLDHCAMNVALYSPGQGRWAMTERRRANVTRTTNRLEIGPSAVRITGDEIVFTIDETAVPLPGRVRGTVRLKLPSIGATAFLLDAAGRHRWTPIAPAGDITVEFDRPGLRWSGTGYLDSNDGDEPLEAVFRSWNWSRARHGDSAMVLYDTILADGSSQDLAIKIGARGQIDPVAQLPLSPLPPTSIWRIERTSRADPGSGARVVRTLEDTPFYSRSIIATTLAGHPVTAVHESLSLARFRQPVVKAMLPFRMPRTPWAM
jgi:carotenoid 1,2-hydratase